MATGSPGHLMWFPGGGGKKVYKFAIRNTVGMKMNKSKHVKAFLTLQPTGQNILIDQYSSLLKYELIKK